MLGGCDVRPVGEQFGRQPGGDRLSGAHIGEAMGQRLILHRRADQQRQRGPVLRARKLDGLDGAGGLGTQRLRLSDLDLGARSRLVTPGEQVQRPLPIGECRARKRQALGIFAVGQAIDGHLRDQAGGEPSPRLTAGQILLERSGPQAAQTPEQVDLPARLQQAIIAGQRVIA